MTGREGILHQRPATYGNTPPTHYRLDALGDVQMLWWPDDALFEPMGFNPVPPSPRRVVR